MFILKTARDCQSCLNRFDSITRDTIARVNEGSCCPSARSPTSRLLINSSFTEAHQLTLRWSCGLSYKKVHTAKRWGFGSPGRLKHAKTNLARSPWSLGKIRISIAFQHSTFCQNIDPAEVSLHTSNRARAHTKASRNHLEESATQPSMPSA